MDFKYVQSICPVAWRGRGLHSIPGTNKPVLVVITLKTLITEICSYEVNNLRIVKREPVIRIVH